MADSENPPADASSQGHPAEKAHEGIAGPGGVYLDQYILLEKLSASRTGVVYKAKHRLMGRLAAVKFLSAEAAASEMMTSRFQRAIKILSRLEHPNVVCAYEASQQNGQLYLVMEYIDGRDLRTMLKEYGPPPLDQAVDYILQTAAGMAHAHEHGVVHRNLKPGNLILDQQGVIKIVGFSLAHVEAGGIVSEASLGDNLTRLGQVMGTYDYMSPEQAVDSSTVDARTDIYSLGCTMHALLTGKPPYVAKAPMQQVLAHRSQPIPSLRAACPEVPEALDHVFQRMLAKQVEDRQASMREVIAELEACLASTSSDAPLPAASPPPAPPMEPEPQPAAPPIAVAPAASVPDLEQILSAPRPPKEAPQPAAPAAPSSMRGTFLIGGAVLALVLAPLVWITFSRQSPQLATTTPGGEEAAPTEAARQAKSDQPGGGKPEKVSVDPSAPGAKAGTSPETPPNPPLVTPAEPPAMPVAAPIPETKPVAAVESKPAEQPPAETPAPPVQPTPASPGAETEPPPERSLLAIPGQDARDKARRLLRETYQDEFSRARGPAEKAALAQKLLTQAVGMENEPVERYVLIETSGSLAQEAGDAVLAARVIDVTAKHYRIDPWTAKVEMLNELAKGARGTQLRKTVAEQAFALAGSALDTGQYASAATLDKLAMAEAVKVRDVKLIAKIRERNTEIDRILVMYREYQAAKEKLDQPSPSAEAQLAVGRFECFIEGAWDRGLPRLSAGSDTTLRALAAKDRANPESVDEQMTVGDGWWSLAAGESGRARRNLLARAGYWYEKAATKAGGLAKTKLDKRLETIRASDKDGAVEP